MFLFLAQSVNIYIYIFISEFAEDYHKPTGDYPAAVAEPKGQGLLPQDPRQVTIKEMASKTAMKWTSL